MAIWLNSFVSFILHNIGGGVIRFILYGIGGGVVSHDIDGGVILHKSPDSQIEPQGSKSEPQGSKSESQG